MNDASHVDINAWYERHRAVVTDPTRTRDERLAAAETVLQRAYGKPGQPEAVDARRARSHLGAYPGSVSRCPTGNQRSR